MFFIDDRVQIIKLLVKKRKLFQRVIVQNRPGRVKDLRGLGIKYELEIRFRYCGKIVF